MEARKREGAILPEWREEAEDFGSPFSMSEYIKALNKLKLGRAPGTDTVPIEADKGLDLAAWHSAM